MDVRKERNSLAGKLSDIRYIKVGYVFLLKFDTYTAVFLSFLVLMEIYNRGKGTVEKDGSFMLMREYVESKIGLTKKVQIRVTKELVDAGLIETSLIGMPRKVFIKINHSKINNLLDAE